MSEIVLNEDIPEKPRYLWAAIWLFILGGAGYLYLGNIRKYFYFILYLFISKFILMHGLWGSFSYTWVLCIFTVAVVLIYLYFFVDIFYRFKNNKKIVLKWYNRGKYYFISVLFFIFVYYFSVELIFWRTDPPIRSFSVPSDGMSPNLVVGDVFLADSRIFENADPARGDVVVFRKPVDENVVFVSRIIGLPGDKIKFVNGVLHLNQKIVQRAPVQEMQNTRSNNGEYYTELLANNREYIVWEQADKGPFDDTPEYHVPPGHYFVVSDNRDNAVDSRAMELLGYVSRENIFARAGGIILSDDISRIGTNLN